MSGAVPRFVYGYGMPDEREFPLLSPTATIGRESINEIVFNDAEISRRHLRVTQLAGRYIIEDLGSTNGTFLNGRRIEAPAPLANGDVIDLGGSIRLTYLGPPGAAEATVIEPTPGQLGAVPTVPKGPGQELPPDMVTPPPYEAPAAQPPQDPVYQAAVPQTVPQTPPPQAQIAPPYEPPQKEGTGWTRYLIGAGCLLILAIIACAATVFLLDALAPDALYCGPFQSIFETFGYSCS